jgi:transposase
VEKLLELATLAESMPSDFSILSIKISFHLDGIASLQGSLNGIEAKLREMVEAENFPQKIKMQIDLLDQMPGIGFITAVTLISEIGDFDMFKSPKALTAFFGIDPSVNQSGKFTGDRNKISKRGTRLGRRALFTAALSAIRTTRNGVAINPILRDYYTKKCINKKKKVALVAVMHKLLNYIFAVLRDEKPFQFRNPEDHQTWRVAKLSIVA